MTMYKVTENDIDMIYVLKTRAMLNCFNFSEIEQM